MHYSEACSCGGDGGGGGDGGSGGGDFQGVLVDIHVVVGAQIDHVTLTCALLWLNISREVVVLFSSFEGPHESIVHLFLLIIGQSESIQPRKKLWLASHMSYIPSQVCLGSFVPLVVLICPP